MFVLRKALGAVLAAGFAAAAEPVPTAQEPVKLPLLLDTMRLPEVDAQEDTVLIKLARGAYNMPSAVRSRLFEPLIESLLLSGYDPLHENESGCNAVFYLAGMPDFYQRLHAEGKIPRELALRIPHEERALLRYMRLRNNQALLVKSAGSRDYLTRRYCTPAFARAERLVRNYLAATTITRIPDAALADSLAFMHLGNAAAAEAFVNSLPIWEHGEHFLEEIPAHFLTTLHSMRWRVDSALLRKALHKLGSMLPVSKDDMIECAASAPMSRILEMLTELEGTGAMPELQQYAAAFDPEIVHTALALQMKLQGIPLPWEPAFAAFSAPELSELRHTLRVDAAIRYGRMNVLTAQQIREAAAVIRKHNMPMHASMLEDILEGDSVVLRPELRPAFRTRYEEIREDAPHVVLLRFIIEHPELRNPVEEGQP